MLSSNNILSPANGKPLAVPSQDLVLGCYYLTKAKPGAKGEGKVFGSFDEVVLALESGHVELLTPIRVRVSGQLLDLTKQYNDQDIVLGCYVATKAPQGFDALVKDPVRSARSLTMTPSCFLPISLLT